MVLAFVRLARLPFLIGGFAGFGLGAAVARFDGAAVLPGPYLLGQLVVTAFQLMVHFANDYFDQVTDAVSMRTPWSGGSGVLVEGAIPARWALRAALSCGGLGVLASGVLAFSGNVLAAGVGATIAVLAWSYSAPPVRLLARGWGEVDTLAVVAVLVPVLGYAVEADRLAPLALLATIPSACAMMAMMLAVELPDRPADAATGKCNLVVRWGARRATVVARACAIASVALLLGVVGRVFAVPAPALVAALPPALAAIAFVWAERLRAIPGITVPFLGVSFYALTTCAALTMVAVAG